MIDDPALAMLMAELGQRMGLGELALDADGACALRFDGRSVINLQHRPNEDALWLYADLGVPASGPALYGDLLRGNLFWRTTFGATLSLSGDEPPHVILALQIPWRGLTGAQLASRLESFLHTAEDWGELVADRGDGADADGRPPADDSSLTIKA
jgi:Tir chaperone protein (CesT) family